MRYAGQGYELRVGIDASVRGVSILMQFARHSTPCMRSSTDIPPAMETVEVVSYRLRARIRTNKVSLQANSQPAAPDGRPVETRRDVRFGATEVDRHALSSAAPI